jgi:hypothetical protein
LGTFFKLLSKIGAVFSDHHHLLNVNKKGLRIGIFLDASPDVTNQFFTDSSFRLLLIYEIYTPINPQPLVTSG